MKKVSIRSIVAVTLLAATALTVPHQAMAEKVEGRIRFYNDNPSGWQVNPDGSYSSAPNNIHMRTQETYKDGRYKERRTTDTDLQTGEQTETYSSGYDDRRRPAREMDVSRDEYGRPLYCTGGNCYVPSEVQTKPIVDHWGNRHVIGCMPGWSLTPNDRGGYDCEGLSRYPHREEHRQGYGERGQDYRRYPNPAQRGPAPGWDQ